MAHEQTVASTSGKRAATTRDHRLIQPNHSRADHPASTYTADDDLVFCHPTKGTPLDPARLTREHLRPALAAAGITKHIRPFHDLRHTALTHDAAAGHPSPTSK